MKQLKFSAILFDRGPRMRDDVKKNLEMVILFMLNSNKVRVNNYKQMS